jgi:hypothetical protein
MILILNNIELRLISRENMLKDCNWLNPKIYKYIEKLEEYAMGILITVTMLCDDRDSVLHE